MKIIINTREMLESVKIRPMTHSAEHQVQDTKMENALHELIVGSRARPGNKLKQRFLGFLIGKLNLLLEKVGRVFTVLLRKRA